MQGQRGDGGIFVQRDPRQATCSPNESFTISGSAYPQTHKVNFCLLPSPHPSPAFGDLKRIVGVIIYSCHCVYSAASACDGRGKGAARAGGVKADNYPLLALLFFWDDRVGMQVLRRVQSWLLCFKVWLMRICRLGVVASLVVVFFIPPFEEDIPLQHHIWTLKQTSVACRLLWTVRGEATGIYTFHPRRKKAPGVLKRGGLEGFRANIDSKSRKV